MAAPTFVTEGEVPAWNSQTSPRNLPAVAVQAGDVLVLCGMVQQSGPGTLAATHDGGAGMPFTLQIDESGAASPTRPYLRMWTAIADGTKSVVCTLTLTGDTLNFGGDVLVFRGSGGIGNKASTNNGTGSGAPQVSITMSQANSVIVVATCDWNATAGARTWLTNAGALTEMAFFGDAASYGILVGYHADAGATGAVTVGISAPATERYAIGAIEVLPAAAGAPTIQASYAKYPKHFLRMPDRVKV